MGRRLEFLVLTIVALALFGGSARLGQVQRVSAADPDKLSSRLSSLVNQGITNGIVTPGPASPVSPVTSGAGSMQIQQNQVLVNIRLAEVSPATISLLEAHGVTILNPAQNMAVYQTYHTVSGSVAPSQLQDLAALAVVQYIEEALAPMHASQAELDGGAVGPASVCAPTIGEGDAQLKANQARAKYGIDGTGVTVGVMSDTYDKSSVAATHAAGDVATGDLPGVGNPCGHRDRRWPMRRHSPPSWTSLPT